MWPWIRLTPAELQKPLATDVLQRLLNEYLHPSSPAAPRARFDPYTGEPITADLADQEAHAMPPCNVSSETSEQ